MRLPRRGSARMVSVAPGIAVSPDVFANTPYGVKQDQIEPLPRYREALRVFGETPRPQVRAGPGRQSRHCVPVGSEGGLGVIAVSCGSQEYRRPCRLGSIE